MEFGYIKPFKNGYTNYSVPPGSTHVGTLRVTADQIYRVPLVDAEAQEGAGLGELLTEEEATQEGFFILTQGDSRRGADSFGWLKQ